VSWPEATTEQRAEWKAVLVGYIGEGAFWRGDLPLPLGVR
jgi:hypothetical protein